MLVSESTSSDFETHHHPRDEEKKVLQPLNLPPSCLALDLNSTAIILQDLSFDLKSLCSVDLARLT